MKIIVGAVISLSPFSAGMAWNWMHLAVGLRKLGHDVLYLEEVGPEWCVDTNGHPCRLEQSVNRRLFLDVMRQFDFEDRACQIVRGQDVSLGRSRQALTAWAREADLIINMAGHVTADFVLEKVKRRVYVDQDPVYTQLWHDEYGKDLNFKTHDVFFSVGLNIGTPHTPIPDCGIVWHHLLPPVVLEYWPFEIAPSCRRFTSVASWKGYKRLCYRGEWYGSKYDEFRLFAPLPSLVDQTFEVTMRRYREEEDGIQLLRKYGWIVRRSSEVIALSSYQRYLHLSRAEIGIAKNAYVKARSGWFSDRSAHYLASAKPVLAQSTGFEQHLPTGRGLLTFREMDEAVAGVEAINGDYEGHCRAARELAKEWLEYTKVLPKMLDLCTT